MVLVKRGGEETPLMAMSNRSCTNGLLITISDSKITSLNKHSAFPPPLFLPCAPFAGQRKRNRELQME